jgi:hypothetical protein
MSLSFSHLKHFDLSVSPPNVIDHLDAAIEVLTRHGMYAELAALYRNHKKHEEVWVMINGS